MFMFDEFGWFSLLMLSKDLFMVMAEKFIKGVNNFYMISLQIFTFLGLCLKRLFFKGNLWSGVLSFLKCINYLSKIYIYTN